MSGEQGWLVVGLECFFGWLGVAVGWLGVDFCWLGVAFATATPVLQQDKERSEG